MPFSLIPEIALCLSIAGIELLPELIAHAVLPPDDCPVAVEHIVGDILQVRST